MEENREKITAIYPGTFDPITLGHIDIVSKALKIFDNVIVAVAESKQKKLLFTLEERVNLVKEALKEYKNVEVFGFKNLLVEFAKEKNCKIIIRGLRAISDFDAEFQMALANKKMMPDINTIFIMPDEKYFYITSSLIKEISRLNGNVSCFVPKNVEEALKKKFAK